jgi:hypothetical protein
MHAMQYEITLPADYDMKIIRTRVGTRGHLLDDFAGLGVKAYLIRERGVHGSPTNAYAPFYLWHDTSGMNHFLWGGAGFQGIVADFGRPVVRHWTGAAFHRGPAGGTPTAATRELAAIPTGADLVATVEREVAASADRARLPGVHVTALAIDPARWELVRFTLWALADPDAPGDRFEVLHLSAPELHDLPTGRLW